MSSSSAAAEAGGDLVQAVVIEARPCAFRHRMWSGLNLSVEVTAPEAFRGACAHRAFRHHFQSEAPITVAAALT
jgi:hypothetical protein